MSKSKASEKNYHHKGKLFLCSNNTNKWVKEVESDLLHLRANPNLTYLPRYAHCHCPIDQPIYFMWRVRTLFVTKVKIRTQLYP